MPDPALPNPQNSDIDPNLPKWERFTPRSGTGLSPGCALVILVFLVIEGTAIWASINGWWVGSLIAGGAIALCLVVGIMNGWFARER